MSPFLGYLKNAVIGVIINAVFGLAVALIAPALLGDLSQLTPGLLTQIAGVLMALSLDKLLFIASWFNALDAVNKAWAVSGSVIGLGVAIFGISCAGWFGVTVGVECTSSGAIGLIVMIASALVGSQAGYLLLVKPRKA